MGHHLEGGYSITWVLPTTSQVTALYHTPTAYLLEVLEGCWALLTELSDQCDGTQKDA